VTTPQRGDKLKIYGQTDKGIVRDNNQDSFRTVSKDGLYLCVVCDGMGGAAGGSTASSTACDAFIENVFEKIEAKTDVNDYSDILEAAVSYANDTVYNLAKANKELSGMGTTICAILTDGKRAWAVSVGDSRIYMFKDGEIYQISHDHSNVQLLIDAGAITKEESKTHPQKNIITKAVGTSDSVECDSYLLDGMGDGFLICSDGLTNYVSDDELKELFGELSQSPETLACTLIDKANSAGGGDNITVLVIVSD
jgi:protein phosphatase